jgi:hypothetical protein
MQGIYILRHNEAAWTILRLGASVVMHDVGHRHDNSALHDLWAAAIEEDEVDACRIPGPTDHDDCLSRRHTAWLGTRIPEWVYDTLLGTAPDKSKWDRYRPDILIATEGKVCQRDMIQQFYGRTIHIVEVKYCHDTDKSTQALRAT